MKLILAPLANISHSGLRMLIHTFGDPDEYFTEMIHAPSLLAGGPFEQWYLRTNPVPEKLVWQLTSPKAEAFVQAIPLVLQHGGIGIDLNMGCSAPPIARTGAGVAWMLKPLDTTAAAVRSVKQALEEYGAAHGRSFRLSVKLRLGASADYAYLLRFCTMLANEGVQLITIHPRTQRQSYARPALHEYTAALAKDLSIPIYGNGDINSAEKLQTAAAQHSACAGWMIGRAAVQKPWIFKEIARTCAAYLESDELRTTSSGGIGTTGTDELHADDTMNGIADNAAHTAEGDACRTGINGSKGKTGMDGGDSSSAPYRIDLEQTALSFLQYLETEQPPAFFLTRAQRFFQFYCDNFSFAHYCRTQVLRTRSREEMEQALHTYFKEAPNDKLLEI